jgi:hypothetical protein
VLASPAPSPRQNLLWLETALSSNLRFVAFVFPSEGTLILDSLSNIVHPNRTERRATSLLFLSAVVLLQLRLGAEREVHSYRAMPSFILSILPLTGCGPIGGGGGLLVEGVGRWLEDVVHLLELLEDIVML